MTQLLQIFDVVFGQQKRRLAEAHRLLQSLERLAGGDVALVGARTANPAARLRRFLGVVGTRTNWRTVVIVTGNRRREDCKIDALVVIVVARTAVVIAVTVVIAVAAGLAG